MSDEPEAKPTKAPHLKAYHWKKGQSGNPGGLPRELKEIIRLAQENSPEAIRPLAEIMKDKSAPPNARVSAAVHILDRGYGKPRETVEATVKQSLEDLVLASYKRAETIEHSPTVEDVIQTKVSGAVAVAQGHGSAELSGESSGEDRLWVSFSLSSEPDAVSPRGHPRSIPCLHATRGVRDEAPPGRAQATRLAPDSFLLRRLR